MTDDKVLDANAKEAGDKYGASPEPSLIHYIRDWVAQEIAARETQQKHASALNPKLRDIIENVRSMRQHIVRVAWIVPLILLALLWVLIVVFVIVWAIKGAPSREVLEALSAPMTALIVGTFASFILVYSALVIGIFSQLKNADDSREQNLSIMPGVVSDAIKKTVSNDAHGNSQKE